MTVLTCGTKHLCSSKANNTRNASLMGRFLAFLKLTGHSDLCRHTSDCPSTTQLAYWDLCMTDVLWPLGDSQYQCVLCSHWDITLACSQWLTHHLLNSKSQIMWDKGQTSRSVPLRRLCMYNPFCHLIWSPESQRHWNNAAIKTCQIKLITVQVIRL